MRSHLSLFAVILCLTLSQNSCTTGQAPADLSRAAIIPRPVNIGATGGSFTLDEKTSIYLSGGSDETKAIGEYLAARLNPATGLEVEVRESSGKLRRGNIHLTLASGLKPGTICQHWATVENAVEAVRQGSKLVMSPARKAYLDMKYNPTTLLGLKWAGYIEADSAYIWDPANLVPGIGQDDILGIEAPLWTETVTNLEEIEYLVFPRLPGYAEIGWSPSALRSWEEYKIRLGAHGARFDNLEVNFNRSEKVPWAGL